MPHVYIFVYSRREKIFSAEDYRYGCFSSFRFAKICRISSCVRRTAIFFSSFFKFSFGDVDPIVQYLCDNARTYFSCAALIVEKTRRQKGTVLRVSFGEERSFSNSRNFRFDRPKMVFNPLSRLRITRVVCIASVGILLFRPNPEV